MSSTPFLPSTLPLLPLAPPQVLFPYLQVVVPLQSTHLALVLNSIAQNAKTHKIEDAGGLLAVVPVIEIERRVGRWACAARVKSIQKSTKDSNTFLVTLEGLARIRLPRSLPPVLSILPPIPLTTSTFSFPIPEIPSISGVQTDLVPLALQILPEQLHERIKLLPPSLLADMLVTVTGVEWEQKVEVLGLADLGERCSRVQEIIIKILAGRGVKVNVDAGQAGPLVGSSRALVRRSQRPPPTEAQQAIPEDLQPLQNKFISRKGELSHAADQAITRELARLVKIPPQSAEYGVGRTYIEWLLALPWLKVSDMGSEIDLESTRSKLDAEHAGLEAVKRRVVEYLAVYRLKKQLFDEAQEKKKKEKQGAIDNKTAQNLLALLPEEDVAAADQPQTSGDDSKPNDNIFRDKGPILLLVGPPGVGKTSIARSLADSLGRKFHRISLGGVRDEAEIRGHRRTYVGALPGMLVQSLRKVGVANPLILLDELDKVGTSNFHGDPAAALLETLDPAQNWNFSDHYLGDVPIDLSQVLFVATANSLDTISAPLLDRCEVIECSGYVTEEKLDIAKRFLLPKQIRENGLEEDHVQVSPEGLLKVVTDYTREAGVRSLEREIGKVCRSKAVEFAIARHSKSMDTYTPTVSPDDVERILGVAKYEQEVREGSNRPGVVTGLAYQGSGNGGILLIETSLIPQGKGKLVMTGSLGDVISESADLALAVVRSRAATELPSGLNLNRLHEVDIHLHLPSGAVKKDGPSAGLAMSIAFLSLLSGQPVPANMAFTGEITLRGAVTPVGGIKEKVIGAHRAGITRIVLPARNKKDVMADLPRSVQNDLEISFVSTLDEAVELVWGTPKSQKDRFEARL